MPQQVAASHRGRVLLAVRLWPWTLPSPGMLDPTVVLEAGDELSRATRDLADLVRPPATG